MNDEKGNGFGGFIYDMMGILFKVLCVMLIVMLFFFRQVTVDGPSMNDTLQDKDRLIVWSFNYTPQQGDIVTISHGAMLEESIIKRVIAVAGQQIDIDYSRNEVSVDGVLLHESYVKGKTIKPLNPIKSANMQIPEGYVFVMGDNREHSTDSRSVYVDIVPVNNVMGKAIFRIYPWESFGAL